MKLNLLESPKDFEPSSAKDLLPKVLYLKSAFHSDELVVSGSMDKLQKKLKTTLLEARSKRDSFSGKLTYEDENEIEFF